MNANDICWNWFWPYFKVLSKATSQAHKKRLAFHRVTIALSSAEKWISWFQFDYIYINCNSKSTDFEVATTKLMQESKCKRWFFSADVARARRHASRYHEMALCGCEVAFSALRGLKLGHPAWVVLSYTVPFWERKLPVDGTYFWFLAHQLSLFGSPLPSQHPELKADPQLTPARARVWSRVSTLHLTSNNYLCCLSACLYVSTRTSWRCQKPFFLSTRFVGQRPCWQIFSPALARRVGPWVWIQSDWEPSDGIEGSKENKQTHNSPLGRKCNVFSRFSNGS